MIRISLWRDVNGSYVWWWMDHFLLGVWFVHRLFGECDVLLLLLYCSHDGRLRMRCECTDDDDDFVAMFCLLMILLCRVNEL